jgi:hypothetical protein
MKLRKAIKLVAAGAAVTASASVLAADPTHGSWTSNGGDIDASLCPAGYTCSSTPISENGFMQRQITENVPDGRTFIQTIILEGDVLVAGGGLANGTGFADESFVRIGGTGGIIDKQMLAETADLGGGVNENFTSTSNISSGEFRYVDQNAIDIQQAVNETGGAEGFDTTFRLQEMDNSLYQDQITAEVHIGGNTNGEGFTAGFKMETFVVEDTTGSYASANLKRIDADQTLDGGGSDVYQTFALRERTGASISDAGSTSANNGSNSSWTTGETIVSLRIGQDVAGAGQFGLDDFSNESSGGATGIDSFSSSAVPFQDATFAGGGDPFADITAF